MRILKTPFTFDIKKHFSEEQQKVFNILTSVPGCYIAGGAALAMYDNNPVILKDFDVYCNTKTIRRIVYNKMYDVFGSPLNYPTYPGNGSYLYNYLTFSTLTQLMLNKSKSLKSLFRSFDFTVCCFATDGKYYYFTPQAKRDLIKREIVCNEITSNELKTISRLKRYKSKGFRLNNEKFWNTFNKKKRTFSSGDMIKSLSLYHDKQRILVLDKDKKVYKCFNIYNKKIEPSQ